MTAPINQLHISLIPAQDRLLLRVGTATERELRFWMTRRFVKALWPVLLEALQADPTVAGQADPRVRREVLSFQHQQAVQDTEFTKEYKASPQTRPLTQTPLLLTGARCEVVNATLIRLQLITARNKMFGLTLDRKTVHSICKLIADCAEKAGWGLDLPLAEPVGSGRKSARTIN
jgi:hypothetical protein